MPQMSIRLGAFFGQSEDFWHGVQVECDFRALREKAPRITQYVQTAESLMICED